MVAIKKIDCRNKEFTKMRYNLFNLLSESESGAVAHKVEVLAKAGITWYFVCQGIAAQFCQYRFIVQSKCWLI